MTHENEWDNLEWDEELGDFVKKDSAEDSDNSEEKIITKDSNGNILESGDSVTLIKDLDVKGSPLTLKRGEKIKKIKLIDDPENIECKIGKSTLVLKTCFLKKS